MLGSREQGMGIPMGELGPGGVEGGGWGQLPGPWKKGTAGGHRPPSEVWTSAGREGYTPLRTSPGAGGLLKFQTNHSNTVVGCSFSSLSVGQGHWTGSFRVCEYIFLMVSDCLTLVGQKSPLLWGHTQKSGENACVP